MAEDNTTTNRSNNPGNFANDREKASEAGQKGGQMSGGSRDTNDRSAESGRKPDGTFAKTTDKDDDTEQKSGQANAPGGRQREEV